MRCTLSDDSPRPAFLEGGIQEGQVLDWGNICVFLALHRCRATTTEDAVI